MRVKWNRNLDGNTIVDSSEFSDSKEGKSSEKLPVQSKLSSSRFSSSPIPMRSRNRENGKSSRGCALIFGPRRSKSTRSTSAYSTPPTDSRSSSTSSRSSSSPPPSTRQQSPSPKPIDSDRTTMTKLSNFLGIFKLTPSAPSSTNGSVKGSSKSSSTNPTSIKIVRRSSGKSDKSGYESDGLFRTDSRRRRRANNLLQKNSDIRRSWNAAMTRRPDVSVRGPWLRPGSPNYRPPENNFRSISPSIIGTSSNDSTHQAVGSDLNGSRPPSSLDGSGHFGNSCKVNSMPAPIVTLPECCLEGSDGEGVGGSPTDPMSQSEIDFEIENQNNGHCEGCDEVDRISHQNARDKIQQQNYTSKQNGSIVRPSGPPPPPPTSSTLVSYDGSLRSADDVFIQVQITASSTKSKSPENLSTPNGVRPTINGRLPGGQQGTSDSITYDENGRPLSPIFESCTEKINYEESISPTGSLADSRIDSRSSGEVEEDVNTYLDLRPPSSNAGSSSSTEMTLSEDGGIGESVSYDTSSGGSWETSSILAGSVCFSPDAPSNHSDNLRSVSDRMSPSTASPLVTTSTPHHNHHHFPTSPHPTSPINISDHPHHQVRNVKSDESYLHEPRVSEVVKVTVKKAQIPEVVTLKSEDIIDLDSTGSTDDSPSPSFYSSSSISSVQRIHGGRKGSRTGILKDSNCLNASNGHHNCRNSTPKKVHFAESAKQRAANAGIGVSDPNQVPKSTNYDSRSSPSPSLVESANQLLSKSDKSSKLMSNNNSETTISASSTVTIRKPSSSSRRLFQSTINQNGFGGSGETTTTTTNEVAVDETSSEDYSSEQISVSTTQINPESYCLSDQSSFLSSLSSSSSSSLPLTSTPQLTSSLSVKSQARFFESIARNSRVASGISREEAKLSSPSIIKPADCDQDNDNDTGEKGRDWEREEEQVDGGQSINSKSQMGDPTAQNVSTINCTRSVAHVRKQNTPVTSLVSVSSVTSTSSVNPNGANSGFPYLSRELDAHRKLSALHQRKLAIAREESARSSLIIQGLGVVVQRLTQQLDSLNGPTLRSQLSQVQSNFNQLEASFNSQEEALRSLQANYSRAESELRQEVAKLTSELADEERRHEREKVHLINSFELELDAGRKQFNQELAALEEVKEELKSLVNSLRSELRMKVNELDKTRDQMAKMEVYSRQERNGQARQVEERLAFMSKEIQSLKDVLELKEDELKRLRIQSERDEHLNRDLVRAQSTIEALRQRLEQLEIARETQTDAVNRLKAENEALIGEMIRDQREMDRLALRKEELEYTLYNMVTINGDDDRLNNNSPQSGYDQYDVSYSNQMVDHQQPLPTNGNANCLYNGVNHSVDCEADVIIDEDKIAELKRKRKTIGNNQEIRSTFVSSTSRSPNYNQHLSPVSTSIRIEKNISTSDCYNNYLPTISKERRRNENNNYPEERV